MYLLEASYIPIRVKFTDIYGGFEVRIPPVWDTLNAADKGKATALREIDIARLNSVLNERHAIFSGQKKAPP